jgi:uncharacterized protein (TIGR02996 family)
MKLPAGLLQEVLATPQDDAPRLVCADWLEEHGDDADLARAEFIRVQCELARLPEGDSRVLDLRRREHEQLIAHHKEWRNEAPSWAQPYCAFQRGFLGYVQCTIGDFLRRGPSLLRRCPVEVAALRTTMPGHFDALASSPLLSRLSELRLNSGLQVGGTFLTTLLNSPHIIRLRGLSLDLTERAGWIPGAIANSRLESLQHLHLDGYCRLGPSLAETLAAAPILRNLRTLWINYAQIGQSGVEALAASPHLANLTTLGLPVEQVDAEGAAVLARWIQNLRLTELDLDYSRQLRDEGLAALAASPGLATVRALWLTESEIGTEGIQALARSPHAAGLRILGLMDNYEIDDAGAEALAESPYLGELTFLHLMDCWITPASVEILATSPRLPKLARIIVRGQGGARRWQPLKRRFGERIVLEDDAWPPPTPGLPRSLAGGAALAECLDWLL